MNQNNNYRELFSDIYSENQIRINASMKDHIYFEVGGPADVLLLPTNVEQVIETISICKKEKISYNFLFYT